jgi:hypothetical protein
MESDRYEEIGQMTVSQYYEGAEHRWHSPVINGPLIQNLEIREVASLLDDMQKAFELALKWNRDTGRKMKRKL